jgi:hypothetical protein
VGSEIAIGLRVLILRRCEFAVHVAVGAELAVGVAAGVDCAQAQDVDGWEAGKGGVVDKREDAIGFLTFSFF